MINILVKVNGLFHVLFNTKNEFVGIGLIQKRKSINKTEAVRIKSKNRHIRKNEMVPLRSLNQSVGNAGVAFVKGADERNKFFEKINKQ